MKEREKDGCTRNAIRLAWNGNLILKLLTKKKTNKKKQTKKGDQELQFMLDRTHARNLILAEN